MFGQNQDSGILANEKSNEWRFSSPSGDKLSCLMLPHSIEKRVSASLINRWSSGPQRELANRMSSHSQSVMCKVRVEMLRPERLVLEKEIGEGETVKDLLNKVATTHKEFVEVAFDLQKQKLTGEMAIVLNGQLLNALETKISNGDVVILIPILAGG